MVELVQFDFKPKWFTGCFTWIPLTKKRISSCLIEAHLKSFERESCAVGHVYF